MDADEFAFEGGRGLEVGPAAGADTGPAEEVASVLVAGGVAANPLSSRGIRAAVWEKLCNNAVFNPLSVALGATLGQIGNGPGHGGDCRSGMAEIRAVGEATGIGLESGIDDRIAFSAAFGPFRTSMLQDWEAGAGRSRSAGSWAR